MMTAEKMQADLQARGIPTTDEQAERYMATYRAILNAGRPEGQAFLVVKMAWILEDATGVEFHATAKTTVDHSSTAQVK